MHVIETTNKNNKVLVNMMDCINLTQEDIGNNRTKGDAKTLKENLNYTKNKNKNMWKMNNKMINILANLSIAMCHTFIKDPKIMFVIVPLFDSFNDETNRPTTNTI